ncbi:hypothetical protein VTI28DRAFT_2453 [Corynascus sepedonium]
MGEQDRVGYLPSCSYPSRLRRRRNGHGRCELQVDYRQWPCWRGQRWPVRLRRAKGDWPVLFSIRFNRFSTRKSDDAEPQALKGRAFNFVCDTKDVADAGPTSRRFGQVRGRDAAMERRLSGEKPSQVRGGKEGNSCPTSRSGVLDLLLLGGEERVTGGQAQRMSTIRGRQLLRSEKRWSDCE